MSDQEHDIDSSTAPPRPRFVRLRWLADYLVRPLLLFAVGIGLLASLGLAQRQGWIKSGTGSAPTVTAADSSVEYICPMMCVPPMKEPGRDTNRNE